MGGEFVETVRKLNAACDAKKDRIPNDEVSSIDFSDPRAGATRRFCGLHLLAPGGPVGGVGNSRLIYTPRSEEDPKTDQRRNFVPTEFKTKFSGKAFSNSLIAFHPVQ